MKYAVIAALVGVLSLEAAHAGEESSPWPLTDVGAEQPRLTIPAEEWREDGGNVADQGTRPEPSTPGGSITERAATEVESYRDEKAHFSSLEGRLREAQLRAGIAEELAKCREAGGCPESAPSKLSTALLPMTPDSTAMSMKGGEEVVSVPSLESVVGDKGLFLTPHGRLYAGTGSVLPGGFRVVRLRLKEAMLDRNGVEYRIALKWEPKKATGNMEGGISPVSGLPANN